MHTNLTSRWRSLVAVALLGLGASLASAQALKVDPAQDDPAPAAAQPAPAVGGIQSQNIFQVAPDAVGLINGQQAYVPVLDYGGKVPRSGAFGRNIGELGRTALQVHPIRIFEVSGE